MTRPPSAMALPWLSCAMVAGLWPRLAQADHPVLVAEALRLAEAGLLRRAEPGGAVELIRLHEFARWVSRPLFLDALRARATDKKTAPLNRAVAWWLLRKDALDLLDEPRAIEAKAALGLLDDFVMRPGKAPHPSAELAPAGWRVYPKNAGAGALYLESFLRPAEQTTATVASRITGRGGPAVLRLGYDDEVTVWLNGDEVYIAPNPHEAWLDQAAIPIALNAGDNRLVIEVRQSTGAWRLIARITDEAGSPALGVSASADPWGEVPDRAPEEPPEQEAVAHLWRALVESSEGDAPKAQDLRDYADYARVTSMPDPDQSMPRVAIESAWDDDPSPSSLRAWLRILPEAERGGVRAAHASIGPMPQADHFAAIAMQIEEAWEHYYQGRILEVRRLLDATEAVAPGYPPAVALRAVTMEWLELAHGGTALLEALMKAHPGSHEPEQAYLVALQTAGRTREAQRILERRIAENRAGADDFYQLAQSRKAQGDTEGAIALLDEVSRRRPELWGYALEIASLLRADGRREAAIERLEGLLVGVGEEPTLLATLGELHAELGDKATAARFLRRSLEVEPADDDRRRYLDALTGAKAAPTLGPSLEALLGLPNPEGADAVVLYHHASTNVSFGGLASRRVRRVVRVLTEAGARAFDTVQLSYVPGNQRLLVETARLIRPNQPPTSPSRDDIDLSSPEYRLYYDLRAEVLSFPRLLPNDVLELAWRLDDIDTDPAFPGYYGEIGYLQEGIPRIRSVLEITGPAVGDLGVQVVDLGLTVLRAETPRKLRFEAIDVPAVRYESEAPGPSSMRAYVHVSNAPSWAEVDRRYRRLLQGRDRPDKQLSALALAWSAGASTIDEKLARLYQQVADKTRYVGLELGLHSFQPERPAVTLARGYGDCKDKATLLIALARALGIEARLALVRTRTAGAIEAKPASLAIFDHAIVYVPALDRFMDPTVDRNDPWNLPPSDQGAFSFVIGGDAEPHAIPPHEASHNQSEWSLDLELLPDGRARGRAKWLTRGQPATVARHALEAEGQRRQTLQGFLNRRFPGANVGEPKMDGLSPAFDPVVADADISLPPFRAVGGGFDVPLGGSTWDLVEWFAREATRETPLQLEVRRRVSQTVRLRLPAAMNARVPEPVVLDGPFGRFSAEATASGRELTLVAHLEQAALQVSPGTYPAFRQWLAAIDHKLATAVEIRP